MQLAEQLAATSRCGRNQVGCVMVKDGKILVSAVNGQVVGAHDCDELGGCIREQRHIKSGTEVGLCYAACAETRCVCEAARQGIALQGATVYCTHKPCLICMKNLVLVGVEKIYYQRGYPDQNSDKIAQVAGVPVVQYG